MARRRSNTDYISKKYYPGARKFRYYDVFGKERFVYSYGDIPEPEPLRTGIEIVVGLIVAVLGAGLILNPALSGGHSPVTVLGGLVFIVAGGYAVVRAVRQYRFLKKDFEEVESYEQADLSAPKPTVFTVLRTELPLLLVLTPFVLVSFLLVRDYIADTFPVRLTPEYLSPASHIDDAAGYFPDREGQLEKYLSGFEEVTGICPYVVSLNRSECGREMERDLNAFDSIVYNRLFDDEQHFLIIAVKDDVADEWEGNSVVKIVKDGVEYDTSASDIDILFNTSGTQARKIINDKIQEYINSSLNQYDQDIEGQLIKLFQNLNAEIMNRDIFADGMIFRILLLLVFVVPGVMLVVHDLIVNLKNAVTGK